jgi:toxin ParE1/3/4
MARRIETSREALADFDAIYDHIDKENPRAAAGVLRSLDRAIQRLVEQPKLGRIYRHRRHGLRVLVHRPYLVFYRERPGIVDLVRVLDGRRNIPDILDEL